MLLIKYMAKELGKTKKSNSRFFFHRHIVNSIGNNACCSCLHLAHFPSMAFKLEKQRQPFEDESDEQTDLQEQDEFDLNERGNHGKQKEREEQDENDEDNKRLKIGSCTKKNMNAFPVG